MVKLNPFIILLYSPPPIPGIVAAGLIFPFSCVHNISIIFTLLHLFLIFFYSKSESQEHYVKMLTSQVGDNVYNSRTQKAEAEES
jgi:hypothetical protein